MSARGSNLETRTRRRGALVISRATTPLTARGLTARTTMATRSLTCRHCLSVFGALATNRRATSCTARGLTTMTTCPRTARLFVRLMSRLGTCTSATPRHHRRLGSRRPGSRLGPSETCSWPPRTSPRPSTLAAWVREMRLRSPEPPAQDNSCTSASRATTSRCASSNDVLSSRATMRTRMPTGATRQT